MTEEGSDKENNSVLSRTKNDTIIGNRPFGEGLQLWLMLIPTFKLDRVKAAIISSCAKGRFHRYFLYAGGYTLHSLRYLHKPVDLIMLNTDEHVLTNPSLRMASQGGSVDWFRFWLQGYGNPDPSRSESNTGDGATRGFARGERNPVDCSPSGFQLT